MENANQSTTKIEVVKTKKTFKQRLENAVNYVKDNGKTIAAIGIPAALIGVRVIRETRLALTEIASRRKSERTIYDPKVGFSWHLRRPLNELQKLELAKRMRAGETMGDILESMRALK